MNAHGESEIEEAELQPEEFEELLRRAARRAWFGASSNHHAKGESIMDFAQVGETAGAIWQALTKDGPQNIAALMEEVDAPQSVFFMAVGWLAREDKLEIEPANGDYTVRLK